MATAPKSEILNMAELVEYNDGAVVSRQITKADGGNVTLFAFDKDQELSEHTAPFDALVHVLDGETEITIAGKPFQLKTGDAIIMPADEPHAV
ncbi:MAG TPA: cupin domain-containing protein, partial [Anaerolineales bacterium]|nr:cupin domain-containing protein [Anaerolineales bacterium]